MTEQVTAMHPRNDAGPEPGSLFRPAAPESGRRTGAEAQGSAPHAAAASLAGGSSDVQATVKVQAVRPADASDATVVSSPPPGTKKKNSTPDAPADPKVPNGSGASVAEGERSTSATRTG